MRLNQTAILGGGLILTLFVAGCGGSGTDDNGTPMAGATSLGGAVGTGGVSASGGVSTSGGASSGGASAAAGGSTSTGGSTTSGGAPAAGGTQATGGAPISGGGPSMGGASAGGSSVGGSSAGGTAGGGGIGTNGGATSAGGNEQTGGAAGSGTGGGGTIITHEGRDFGDGECRPLCVDAGSDPDGDGWGWEEQTSCVVVGSDPYNSGASCTIEQVVLRPVGGGECPAPVNPNASTQARNLLCYLYEIYGSYVLSGQQETSWDADPAEDVQWITDTTGEHPAVLGGDYLYPNGTTDRAIAWAQAGGITMLRYHMGAPPLADTYENSQQAVSSGISSVLEQGTPEHTSFLEKLDYAAAELQRLEDANVPVLWAPFHEASGDWFWWGMDDGAYVVELWNFTYDYLTNTKGLDNLIWLFPFAGAINEVVYPGRATVDLAGPDTYDTNQPFAGLFNRTVELVGQSLPIPLHENGMAVDPNVMFQEQTAPWVLFNIWATYQNDGTHNTVDGIQTAYSSQFTINRDDLPSFD